VKSRSTTLWWWEHEKRHGVQVITAEPGTWLLVRKLARAAALGLTVKAHELAVQLRERL